MKNITNVSILLVTCCLEEMRLLILKDVIKNMKQHMPDLLNQIFVFDNGSTLKETHDVLNNTFVNVYQSDKNIGYWSAINWWLNNVADKELLYIIESDMLHYDFHKFDVCVDYMLNHNDVGSLRLQKYEFDKRNLYNKNSPHINSDRTNWQAHINSITNKPIWFNQEFIHSDVRIFKTNFLPKLPTLTRNYIMKDVFDNLSKMTSFTEQDFQFLYQKNNKITSILDGGIYNLHDLVAPSNSKAITGSYPNEQTKKLGYKLTRCASIVKL